MNRPPAPRAPVESSDGWSLAELGRSVTHLTGAVKTLTETVGQLGVTMAELGTRLRTVERFGAGAVGAAASLAIGAVASGHVHWG